MTSKDTLQNDHDTIKLVIILKLSKTKNQTFRVSIVGLLFSFLFFAAYIENQKLVR